MNDSLFPPLKRMDRRRFMLAAGAAGIAACARRASDSIKVGVLHSLTGTMAMSEAPLRDAAIFAIEEINASGGLLGRKVEPIVEDAASDPDRFQMLTEKLLAQDKVCSIF